MRLKKEYMMKRIMNSSGFTMVELMISVSILSLMIAGMTVAFQQQQRQFHLTKEAAEIDQTGRATLDFLASEVRNAASRQGKTFGLLFFNGGSDENCADDTDLEGRNSPPDCITVFTWDITRGQNGTDLNTMPSVPGLVQVVESGSSLKLQLPPEWFPDSNDNKLIGETDQIVDVLLGFRSRVNLCSPDSAVNCSVTPEKCTECAALLRSTVDSGTRTATIDDVSDIKAHNFPMSTIDSLGSFVGSTTIGSGVFGFLPTFSSQPAEMTIVDSKTFRVNSGTRELEMSINGGPFLPIAGGVNSAGIVDLQMVFNLQDSDGVITKVGVPLSAEDKEFPDFSEEGLLGREQDIRSVEIYLVVKSKIQPRRIRGGKNKATIPALGDAGERTVASPSSTTNEPEEGFIYSTFSTTIYLRNHTREEFG